MTEGCRALSRPLHGLWMHHVLNCCFRHLSDLTFLAMFPGRWPNFPESMWNFGWSTPSFTSPQSTVPPGQFCGSDPSYQQSQAQAQAQISALQQQNALLNQQLHNQSQSHINHLQQLLPHHQIQQQPPPVSPLVQPSPSAQHQVHLNHRPLRCPHQVQQIHHSIPLRCCNK